MSSCAVVRSLYHLLVLLTLWIRARPYYFNHRESCLAETWARSQYSHSTSSFSCGTTSKISRTGLLYRTVSRSLWRAPVSATALALSRYSGVCPPNNSYRCSTSRQFSSSNRALTMILPSKEDKYDGVIIDVESLPPTDESFANSLQESISHWIATHRRGVWLKIPLLRASLVPIAASEGFVFHHAERDYVMMTKWLPAGESRLPPNASHQVGVGSVVIWNDKLLLVQEKNGPLRGKDVWKLPTGLSDPAEDICDSAVREVFEETGIRTKFTKLLCFRQSHNVLFGKSDLFFICILEPMTFDITECATEIAAAGWHDPRVLTDQDFFRSSPLYSLLNNLLTDEVEARKGKRPPVPSLTTKKLPIGIRPGESNLYYFDRDQTASS